MSYGQHLPPDPRCLLVPVPTRSFSKAFLTKAAAMATEELFQSTKVRASPRPFIILLERSAPVLVNFYA